MLCEENGDFAGYGMKLFVVIVFGGAKFSGYPLPDQGNNEGLKGLRGNATSHFSHIAHSTDAGRDLAGMADPDESPSTRGLVDRSERVLTNGTPNSTALQNGRQAAKASLKPNVAPAHIVDPLKYPNLDMTKLSLKLLVTDFGEALSINNPPKELGAPISFSAPKLLFGY